MTSTNPHALASAGRIPAPSCAACKVRQLCLPDHADEDGCAGVDRLVLQRYRLLRGEHLYQASDPVRQRLYAIQSGQFKIYRLSPEGRHRVAGFRGAGDLLGLESIGLANHRNSAVALSDAVLCEFSQPMLAEAALRDTPLARRLDQLLLAELTREQAVSLLLCESGAEQKLAGFIERLSAARCRRGEDGRVLELSMTRTDIGDYLGLAAATVSRTLKRFHGLGCLAVSKRQLTILDRAGLGAIASGQDARAAGLAQPGLAAVHGRPGRISRRADG